MARTERRNENMNVETVKNGCSTGCGTFLMGAVKSPDKEWEAIEKEVIAFIDRRKLSVIMNLPASTVFQSCWMASRKDEKALKS